MVVRSIRKEKVKKPKFKEQHDRPSSSIDFDALLPAIVDRQLVVTEQSIKLVFKRADGVDDMFNFAYIVRADPNGDVVIQDETLQQRFIFNLKTDVKMSEHLKIYDKNTKKKAPSAELLAHLKEGIDDAKEGRVITPARCGFCDLIVVEQALHVCDMLPGRHIE